MVLDEYTHYVWTLPLKHKSEVLPILRDFYAYARTQFQLPMFSVQTDNGREFDSHASRELLASHGTVLRLSCPYTS